MGTELGSSEAVDVDVVDVDVVDVDVRGRGRTWTCTAT
jgi:hypothetical protein